MGAIFHVALARARGVDDLPGESVALSADAADVLVARDGDGQGRAITLLVGAERDGLGPELLAACERNVRIPIASDSLNAAMAATVALYELTRGRDGAPRSSRVRT
jgi:TrmH family RNA methyltransferase